MKITLRSEDIAHSLTIDAYRIAKRVGGGQTVTFEFRADQAGTFPIYCNLRQDDGCRKMRGELVVTGRNSRDAERGAQNAESLDDRVGPRASRQPPARATRRSSVTPAIRISIRCVPPFRVRDPRRPGGCGREPLDSGGWL